MQITFTISHLGQTYFVKHVWHTACEQRLLVVEVLSIPVDLVLQGEVKGHMLHFLFDEDLCARGVLLFLQVFDHVREPNSQPVVARDRDQQDVKRCRGAFIHWKKLFIEFTQFF